ncbi:hypothetical protein TVAG_467850 [Trichomonas vaginalis G3]|uniref:MMS19 nucleotide excision repair protein n=1 Tax=Trichomonas vaginalis (strain ATCC PRA-98 / G3) TaxID=412133 RepID=A2E0M5_TRIV3|nr:DNA repair/transcription protein Met18/Mms19 family [Trichomonas vaginalis G3]EAY13770.1 hypothetical protein TVAG_467850 [Trichomonas vaginalis G3]KAI5542713.1 DNA repair/transcription protein Met18/Mms19 family [Trichomonas vaginalis G3]|eukprot:XP_001325993.1 hypothetical protein [Trichomonas vaginalis G3]
MKSLLKNISLNLDNESERQKILGDLILGIDNDEKLQNVIGEILPFATDNDRQLRTASIIALEFINNNFDIKSVKVAILEMATAKLTDSATLFTACKIVKQNFQYASEEYITTIFETLITVDLRSNLLKHRLEAYSLLEMLVNNPALKIAPTQEIIDRFRKFCGYEQDPKCLDYIFKLFPIFSKRILPDINEQMRAQLYDVVSVFYPITARPELSHDLNTTLSLLPEYTEDLCELVSTKLSNALADTRSAVYQSLPDLLIREAPEQSVGNIVVSFAKSLSDYFANGSTDATQEVVDSAVKALVHFVEISKDSHQMLLQSAMQNWIPTIINSTESSTIRAYSIVAWSLDTVLNFSPIALVPLSATAEESLAKKDEARIQAILASVVEFLKFTHVVEKEMEDIKGIFKVAIVVLSSGEYSQNCIVSALVVLREISNKSNFPDNDEVVKLALKYAKVQSFSAQLLCSLADRQIQYEQQLNNELVSKLVSAISENNTEIIGDDKPFSTISEVVAFASRLSVSPFFARFLLPAIAKGGFVKELLKCILPLHEIPSETCDSILSALNALQNPHKDAVLSVAIRSPRGFLLDAMIKYTRISDLLLFAAFPSEVPSRPNLTSDLAKFAYGAKTSNYFEGFHPPAASLCFRNEITSEFCAEDIPILLEMENFFDGATGAVFNKFDLLNERFMYNDEYKTYLWKPFYRNLFDKPKILCKLCLLCPPDFFLSVLSEFILLLPSFIENDTKGGLDLTIFALMSLNKRDQIAMISTMSTLVVAVCDVVKNGDNYERLDACKVLRAMTAQLPTDACVPHKRLVMKTLNVALDDNKREVRNAAALARVDWSKIE